jgi:hypothetical protein
MGNGLRLRVTQNETTTMKVIENVVSDFCDGKSLKPKTIKE